MDKSIPAAAAVILNFIRQTEVGTSARSGYDVIYNNQQKKLRKPVTSMTLLEVQRGQAKQWSNHNHGRRLTVSSATGGYQFMFTTLGGLITELKLDHKSKLDPAMQDRLGFHLLKRRGYARWAAGKLSDNIFAKKLAQEWASFPVLVATKGQKRRVRRGQSYYAGDGLNKALISAGRVEALLAEARAVLVRTKAKASPSPDLPSPADPRDSHVVQFDPPTQSEPQSKPTPIQPAPEGGFSYGRVFIVAVGLGLLVAAAAFFLKFGNPF